MKIYTKEEIKELLKSSNKAIERGLVAIFNQQTFVEQLSNQTKSHNNRGFSAFDAARGSYYAKWILSGRSLTNQHLAKARKLIIKYTSQLTKIANAKYEQSKYMAKKLLKEE